MAQPTNTFSAFDAIGNREDLSDLIANVSPYDTPGISLFGSGEATATLHEWQSDTLDAADGANAVIEGDDAVGDVITPTTRLRNTLQTSDKVVITTTIQERVDKAGRASEQNYQVMKKAKSLKTDMETIVFSNQARDAGSDTVARKLRGMEGWYATNVSLGAGGVVGTDSVAAVDGTQRPLTEALLKTVLQTAYTNGATIKVALCGPFNRTVISGFTAGATKFYNVQDKKLIATVTVYESDFHMLKIVPDRFVRDRTLHLLDPEYGKVSYLEPMQMQDLAITGLTRKKQIFVTYTLEVGTERAHAKVADLTVT